MDFVQKNSVLHSSICRREELPGRSVKVKVIRWYYLHLSGVKRGNAWHIFLKSSEKEGKAHKITDFFKHVDNILNQTEQILFTFHYLCVPDPPGPPNIAGYTSGQVVRTNDTLLLTCTSRGGNPLGTVVWYRNNERVDSSFTSGGNKAINEYTFTAMSTDNGVEYRCEVTNLVTAAPLTDSFTLTVHCEFKSGPYILIIPHGTIQLTTKDHYFILFLNSHIKNIRAMSKTFKLMIRSVVVVVVVFQFIELISISQALHACVFFFPVPLWYWTVKLSTTTFVILTVLLWFNLSLFCFFQIV